jgi:hypothetical protein
MSQLKKWTQEQRDGWYAKQQVKPHRDYALTIMPRMDELRKLQSIKVETYGSVTYKHNNDQGTVDERTHDLLLIRVGDFDSTKPTIVITAGTHGYEKGGVEAALSFAEKEAAQHADTHNILIYPCLCPGPYEIEHRFTQGAIDPNRDALLEGAQSPEMQAFVQSIQDQHRRLFGDNLTPQFNKSADLHETPKLDKTVILQMMEELQGETFGMDEEFPEGMFLITGQQSSLAVAQSMIRRVSDDGHLIVEGELYGGKNREGVLLLQGVSETVEGFMEKFTKHSVTSELCGLYIDDDLDDKVRAEPQLSVIRSLFPAPGGC